MDNVFEILIYIIIIVSFLSSIFKKREKPKQPPVRTTHPEKYSEPETAVPQSQQKAEYDILKEIEDFFSVGEKIPQESNEPTSYKKVSTAENEQPKRMTQIEEHSQTESWHTPTSSEHFADEWEKKKEEVRKKISRVDSKIEKQAAVFEESLKKAEHQESIHYSPVKSRLKHPATLKEYVIISEIIGKPKALRR